MTSEEILSLPEAELYRRVAENLWPWDESRCRVCGYPLGDEAWHRKNGKCIFPFLKKDTRADTLPDLQCWDGVGRMVEAMIGRGFEPGIHMTFGEWRCFFMHGKDWLTRTTTEVGAGATSWEAVARAVLLALAESEQI